MVALSVEVVKPLDSTNMYVPNTGDNYDLLVLDFETEGLDPTKDRILEVACRVVTPDLQYKGALFHECVSLDAERISTFSDWIKTHHGRSGLLEVCQQSKLSIGEIETMLVNHLKSLGYEYFNQRDKTGLILTGNTIAFDMGFIKAYMPELKKYIHYRMFDASTLNIAARMWTPNILKGFSKAYAHRADDDIAETLQELHLYKQGALILNKWLTHKKLGQSNVEP